MRVAQLTSSRSSFQTTNFLRVASGAVRVTLDHSGRYTHTEEYIRARWSAYGNIFAALEHGLEGQDVAIIQSRS